LYSVSNIVLCVQKVRAGTAEGAGADPQPWIWSC